jgi:tRNA (cmo5U34)-methyltransferase
MDYDRDRVVDSYRDMQRAIPGLEAMYLLVRAIMEAALPAGGRLLLVGAGGGRELEALAPTCPQFHFTAVDPSATMLARAKAIAETAKCAGRSDFILGTTTAVADHDLHDGATALLVMHFLADDGSKLAFLRDIRARLKPGAPYLHADVCFDGRQGFEALLPWFVRHAQLQGEMGFEAAMQGVIEQGPSAIAAMPIVGTTRMAELFAQAGFENMQPVFGGLWYSMWAMQAC